MTTDTPTSSPSRWRRAVTEFGWAFLAGGVSTVLAIIALRVDATSIAQRWTVGSDDQILHYTLFTSATQSFPYAQNPALGFPDGFNAFFSSQFDVATAVVVGVLASVVRDGFLLLNLFYLLTFFGVALTGYGFFRALRVRPWVGALMAVVFSLAPYHFQRVGAGHAFLANYWAIPVIGVLVLMVAGEQTDPFARFVRRGRTRARRILRRVLPAAVLAASVAATGGYYFVFGALVVGGVWLIASVGHLLSRRPLRELMPPTLVLALLGGFIGLGAVLLSLGYGVRYAPYFEARTPVESELFGGRLMTLLLPWEGTAVPKVGVLTKMYTAASPLSPTAESPGMPMIASLGFILLFAALPIVMMTGGRALRATAFGRLLADGRVRVLATGVFWSFLFYITTGLGMIVAVYATTTIRAWSRLSLVIALLSLGLIAVLLDRITATAAARYLVAGAVAVLMLFDQVIGVAAAVPLRPSTDPELPDFVAAADAALPDGCGVVELPIKGFPDTGRVGSMADYDEALPYLYTKDGALEWSYGSVTGTYGFDVWADAETPDEFGEAVRESGACAVYVDTAAYTDDVNGWVPFVTDATGGVAPIASSSSGRFLIFAVPAD